MHLPFGLPPTSVLLPFLKEKSKQQEQVTIKFSEYTCACRDSLVGMKPLGVKEGGGSLLEGGIFSGTYGTCHSQ